MGATEFLPVLAKVDDAVARALASGYQVDVDAFELLLSLENRVNVVDMIDKVVQLKKSGETDGVDMISRLDIDTLLSPEESIEDPRNLEDSIDMAKEGSEADLEIIGNLTEKLFPVEGADGFRLLFRSRLRKMLNIAHQRPDSRNIRTISEVLDAQNRDVVKVAGLVMDKRIKQDRWELAIDDLSGLLRVRGTDDSIKAEVAGVMLDQFVIMDVARVKGETAALKRIYHPDLPDRIPTTSKKNVYAVFLSDLHVGSKLFLLDAFERFTAWISGLSEDHGVVDRVRYVVIGGDAVDGAGIYPGQENDLQEPNIRKQYSNLAQLIEKIPKHIRIVIIPGNHDPVRQALPQPAIPRKYAEELYCMENVSMLSSPALLRLHGVKLLTFHGRSLDDVVAKIPGLSYSSPAAAMKLLLRARHLAPHYGGRVAMAPAEEDHLVIDEVPDIFHAGHVHTLDRTNYRGTLILNSGTWQGQTKFQANMGIVPTPGKVPIVNLATLDVLVKDFTKSPGDS